MTPLEKIEDKPSTKLELVVLHAPNAVDFLHGMTLSDAFLRYVVHDPEVVELSRLLKDDDKISPLVFSEGQSPGPFVDFHWPLDLTAKELAYQFVRRIVYFLDEPLPSASPIVERISAVLSDRIGALRKLLVEGKLQAIGTFAQTGFEVPIGRLQWSRSGISVDVQNGDLCEGYLPKFVQKYTGIVLRRSPEIALAVASAGEPDCPTPKSKAEDRARTADKSRRECVEWLCDLIGTSPDRRTRSKEDLWQEAQERWPRTLSKNSFENARQEAIKHSGALAWGYPGPTKGRRQANRCT